MNTHDILENGCNVKCDQDTRSLGHPRKKSRKGLHNTLKIMPWHLDLILWATIEGFLWGYDLMQAMIKYSTQTERRDGGITDPFYKSPHKRWQKSKISNCRKLEIWKKDTSGMETKLTVINERRCFWRRCVDLSLILLVVNIELARIWSVTFFQANIIVTWIN